MIRSRNRSRCGGGLIFILMDSFFIEDGNFYMDGK